MFKANTHIYKKHRFSKFDHKTGEKENSPKWTGWFCQHDGWAFASGYAFFFISIYFLQNTVPVFPCLSWKVICDDWYLFWMTQCAAFFLFPWLLFAKRFLLNLKQNSFFEISKRQMYSIGYNTSQLYFIRLLVEAATVASFTLIVAPCQAKHHRSRDLCAIIKWNQGFVENHLRVTFLEELH